MGVFSEGSIRLPGREVLAFGECGKGTPVLMLHGNPGDRDDWAGPAKLLAERGFRCLAVDRPGHGLSSPLPAEPGQAADACAALLRSNAGGKAIVAGYSMGAHVALDLAQRHRDLVSGVCLVAPYLMPRDENEQPSGLPGLLDIPLLRAVLGLLLPMLGGGKIRRHLETTFKPAAADPALVEELAGRFSTFASLEATLRDKNLFLDTYKKVLEGTATLTCPVLMITGAEDAVSGTASAEAIRKAIPGVLSTVVDGGGHALPWTHASLVADRISGRSA
ncbi:MAG TPA: alpha/beta hydrolase [Candidatus Ozemobacteraceae bacterium]|nr:alpha/beta hydrolase [Candidatus Ozemobacteraceae bacterium]